jgi:hypothetical protein
MRPCPRCRAPLQNRDATCPHCGAAESGSPKPNAEPPSKPSRGNRLWNVYFLLDEPLALVGLLAFIGLFGAVGFLLAGKFGAGCGVAAAIALLIGVAIWAEGE